MRICMVTSVPIPPGEGVGNYVWNLSQYLIRQGHTVQIITRSNREQPEHEVIDTIDIWRPAFFPVYPFHVHLHGRFVNQLLREIDSQVDVYHVHSPLPPVLNTRKPIVLTFHTPMLADAGSIRVHNLQSLLVKLQLPISYQLEKQLLSHSQTVTAVANSVAQELAEYGFNPNHVCVLANGVNTEIFQAGALQSTSTSTFKILAAGRLGLRKGFNDLVRAAALIREKNSKFHITIAGDGPERASLTALIEKLNLQNHISLIGHVSSPAEMANLYQTANLFVHPAHYEGLPTVLLEAMASGCAVVTTGVSGALDVITDGANGLLVPPQQPAQIAEAILHLLENSAFCTQLGQAARKTIEQRYSWQIVGQNYVNTYQQAMAESKVS